MADLHRPCRLSLLSRSTKTPAAAAAADYGDVFGGPPKFSGAPPQPGEYRDIFGGFAAGKSGGAGIPFLDLPALGDDEASVGAGLDYGEVFGCSGSGRFAIDFREVFSELESEERPAVETGQPNIPTVLLDDCNRNSSASDRDQSSPNELSPHIQDGTQQINVSYNKSNYGVQGDLPNGTTHVTELHEVPGFAVVVESSFNSKTAGSATTLNGEHIDLSNEVLEKEIRKETSFQVPFLNNAQKNSRISFLGEEDVQLVRKFTEERKGHVKEAWGISSEKNAMKFNFGTPASDHSLASDEHLSSDGDKSLFRKVFLTVSDISLRTQPSGIPPPSRPPPKLQLKEVKDSIGKVGSGSLPFLDLEVDAKSEAAASAAAMREAMEKAQAKLKSVRESMEKRRPNSRNRRQFGLNEEHRRTAKLLDDDRKQLKVDDAYEASEHGHRTKGNHGSGPMRGASRAFVVSDFNEKIEPKGHTEKVLGALVEGCGKESLADRLSNNIGNQTVELKAEKQFYELVNNGSKHEFVYVSKQGNNDHNFKEKLQDPDQKQSHKPEVPIEIDSLRAYREDDNELEACPELGQAMGEPKAGFEDQRSMNNKEHSLGKDEHGRVRAMLYSRSEKRVEEFKEDISKSKRWTTNDVNGHNKVKADEDNNMKADLEHEEKKRLKEVPERVEKDKRKKAVIELEEEEKRLQTARNRDENEKRLKEAHECEEEEQRLKATCEREEEERRLKAAREHEEEEKRLKAACELEEEEKKLRAAREFEEEEKRLTAAREREEEVKRQRAACERVEEEKWLRAAREREEQEKMLRAAREREEAEKRLRVAREREEEEKRLWAARENEEEERRLRAARGHEEEERRLQAACEHEEEERRLMAAREHKEEEKRLRVAYEHEEEERRLKEDLQREEEDKRVRAALEVEHKRLKAIHEHEEEINRLKAAHDHEEEENQLKAAREHEEEEKRSKAACDSEMEENKLKSKHEEEKSLKVTHEYEDQNERLKAALDRDKEEKQLQAVLEREGEDQWPESLWECEEEEQRLQATYVHEEEENKLQEAYEHAEEEKGLQAADEHNEEQGTLRMAWEHEKDEKKLKVAYEHEEEEKPLQPSCKLGDEKRELIADYECEEDKKKLKVACELDEDEMRQKAACKCEEENRLKDAREQRKDESIRVDEECSEENGRLEFRGHPLPFLFKKKGNNVEYDVQVNIELKNNRSDSKEADVTRGNVKFEKKGLMVSGQEVTTNGSSTARDVFSMTVNEGKSGAARMDREVTDHREREIQKQRVRNMEVERLRILEEERERQKEREKDRIAVENVIRESRDRALAEARERAERAAAERAATESRQRALTEARERAERTSAEKTAIEAARLRAERAAVERATAEARQRAIEKVMVAVKDKPDYSSGQNSFHSDDRSFHATAGETAQRCKARLERHQRTAERAGKALAEKNERDIHAQREQAERNRLAETLDADIRRWSKGKEGNLRALLSTLQYILGPESGWQPVPLTEVITAVAVKKAYRKATLCVHPDKVQQRGASIQQKYICEKVFDLLKDAWNKFNSEER